MFWRGDQFIEELRVALALRVADAGKFLRDYIHDRLSVQGSVIPFVASSPEEYPYRWGSELQDSITYVMGDNRLQAVVYSDAIDEHVNIGHHFSGDEEFGHFWDGWAYDPESGRIVHVAPPHMVAPRPFMRRGLSEATPVILQIIATGSAPQQYRQAGAE